MKMELSAKTAKAFVKGVEKMTEMPLLVFDSNGVKTRTIKNDNTALLDIQIPKEAAESFEYNASNSVEVAVLIADIKDMTKSLVVKDTLFIEYDTDDPTWLILSANGVEKRVRCKNASLIKRHKAPSIQSKWSADLPFKQTKAFLSSCVKESSFEISVSDSMQFEAKNDDEKLTLEFDTDEINLHCEDGEYSTHLTPETFLALLSVASAKTLIRLKGSNGEVVEAHWKEAGLILTGWIAPRT